MEPDPPEPDPLERDAGADALGRDDDADPGGTDAAGVDAGGVDSEGVGAGGEADSNGAVDDAFVAGVSTLLPDVQSVLPAGGASSGNLCTMHLQNCTSTFMPITDSFAM